MTHEQLKKLEWCGDALSEAAAVCPACFAYEDDGKHAKDCWLSAALRAALAPAPACGTWQPIATAPKDGTSILVADAKSVEMGFWQEATDDETDGGVVVIPGFEAGWWGSDWQPGASQPTHWMPLPAAPTEPTR